MKKEDYDKYYNDTKNNYIKCFAYIIASNINSLYCRFNNNHDYKYFQIVNEAENSFLLKEDELELVNTLVEKILKDEYNLTFIDKLNVKVKKIKFF